MFKKILKKPNSGWIIWLGIFLSYIIVGFGVYLWQSSLVNEAKKEQKFVVDQTLAQQEKLLQETAETVANVKNNIVDLVTVKVGDRLANGMVVREIGNCSYQDQDNCYIIFSGPIVVSGSYEYSGDPGTAGEICLQPDENSAKKLPRSSNQIDRPLICFSNREVAKNRFSPNGGKATAAIDYFKLMTMYDFDWAELIKTIEITK